tara:strand:- start:614 stop:1561 length:948 start_codon:yes stop_codon:yes gene_type:complete
MKILITGGCGFKGSVLTNELLKEGHKITIVDTQWFGNYLIKSKNIKIKKKDFRDLTLNEIEGHDAVIHLANIANDPGVLLNPLLSWNVNVLGTQQLVEKIIKLKITHFLFASSGSVYGINKNPKVTENLPLLPISVYNQTKMVAERTIMSYKNINTKIHIIRPATVCGLSPRMRLDVSVNLLTYQALKNKKITVLGGKQVRPNIHIKDMCRVYKHFLFNNKLPDGFYNAGFENISIIDIAKKIQSRIKCKIIIKPSNDPRSYRLDSSKLLKTGFKPAYSVDNAINEIIFNFKKIDKNQKKSFTVKWMKKIGLSKN